MDIRVHQGNIATHEDRVIVLGTWLDQELPAIVAGIIEPADWSAGYKKTMLVYVPAEQGLASRRVLLVGLGRQDAWDAERSRRLGAVVAQRLRDLDHASFTLTPLGADVLGLPQTIEALLEGVILGLYRFDQFKTLYDDRVPATTVEQVTLLVDTLDADGERAAAYAQAVAAGVLLTRDLGNNPPLVATPTYLAETARRIASDHNMVCTILDHDEQLELGMGGLIGVSRGAAEPAKFIILEYGAKEPGVPTIALVGKGITFDTGGISIKPAADMDKMKMDMQGAGAVLGAMEALGRLKLPLHVVALIAATENMPGCNAYKPGDILTALNGVTIEVLNTDAEGRLVLADALSYAQRYAPTAIIDLATLTGGVVVALGSYAAGAMGNSAALLERVKSAATQSGDRVWELPLWDDYRKQIRSDVADIKNTGGRNGSALTAGAFLSHFVGDYPWVHLDIAGVAWTEDRPKEYHPKGATGFGVRLLTELLREWGNAAQYVV